ncbi:MAG: hypothetical protein Q8M83_04320 [bacterium]|nr:hypothetical protein [bacterium]
MYTYIYAACLQKNKHEDTLAAIETNLSIYGIGGDIRRLSNFLTLEGVARDILKRKGATAVVVGDDATFLDTVNLLAGSRAVLGYIPVGESHYSWTLGLPSGEKACEVIAARRIELVDLGCLRKRYFLESAYTEHPVRIRLRCPDFFLETKSKMNFCAANLGFGNPFDGKVEAIIFKKSFWGKEWNIFASVPVEECYLEGVEKTSLILDQCKRVVCAPEITVARRMLQLIVGKGRKF